MRPHREHTITACWELPAYVKLAVENEAKRLHIDQWKVVSQAIENWCLLASEARGAIQNQAERQGRQAREIIEQAVIGYDYNIMSNPVGRYSPK